MALQASVEPQAIDGQSLHRLIDATRHAFTWPSPQHIAFSTKRTLMQEQRMYQVYSGPTIHVCLLTLMGLDTQPCDTSELWGARFTMPHLKTQHSTAQHGAA
jgi:hypothetical protein